MKKEYRSIIRTKKQIRNAFIELLSERQGIGDMTISELADRANIAKSTFYNHYDDIYAVAEEFEDELIENVSKVLDEIEREHATEYDVYIHKVIGFLKENEDLYRKAVKSSDCRLFVEKLKTILHKKVFEESRVLPFSNKMEERLMQIRFITNACVDTIVDCLSGTLDVSLDVAEKTIIELLKRMK